MIATTRVASDPDEFLTCDRFCLGKSGGGGQSLLSFLHIHPKLIGLSLYSMSDIEDEYDAYYSPLDLEGFHSQSPPDCRTRSPTPAAASQSAVLQTSDDEFDAYDFSEFTAADFAQIDAELAATAASYNATSTCAPRRRIYASRR